MGERSRIGCVVAAGLLAMVGGTALWALSQFSFPAPHSVPPIPLGDPTPRALEGEATELPSGHRLWVWPSTMAPPRDNTMWLYLPKGEHAPQSLPVVLIAPAGSDQLTGMPLAPQDRIEHRPYLEHGFAVLAYALDGVGHDRHLAVETFLARQGGLLNGADALHAATTTFPELDRDAVFAVGHSSATGPALLAATHLDLRGVVLFSGDGQGCWTHPETRLGLHRTIPGFEEGCQRTRPLSHLTRSPPPAWVFAVEDDAVVPFAQTQALAEALEATLVVEPSGGHYLPMVHRGIGAAIPWMQEQLQSR